MAPNNPPEPQPPKTLDQIKHSASRAMDQIGSLLKAVREPPPSGTGDGTYLPQPERAHLGQDVIEIFKDIGRQDAKDLDGLLTVVKDATLGLPLNDREYLMESLIAVAAKTPEDFVQTKITDTLVTVLWSDLEHPPQTLLSDRYNFRQPDGSHNSYQDPDVGRAKMPYARTVAPVSKQAACLPDPGVLFDTCLARKNPKGEKHPNRISSMLFYLASIIIHDLFRTDHDDFNQSNTSSYLDLAPLYGSDWEEQRRMRTFKDGKIKPDCFSEGRLLTFPPGVGAMLIMFNRYHNYVVQQLALINEGGRFSVDPKQPTVDRYGTKGLDKRDDDLFQTGRLITCALYVNIILIDYVRVILNLNRTDDDWQLNPRVDIPNGPPRGTGNQCSAEFNLVYRWHSAVSERDDYWTQELFKEMFPGVSAADVSKPENIGMFLGKLKQLADKTAATPPDERQFPALKHEVLERIKDGPLKGSFKDDDLAAILTRGIEDCANAMGPQQVPVVMKAIEMLGISQARTWRCATLNEFRKHFKLNPHNTFEDITENEEVQAALKHLYDTPDRVELYPGLVVEDAKVPKLPGSGLCPSYTVSRGVLSDAVALVRGDRFYTDSYTPALLTNWGYEESNFDKSIDNGCVFHKLFFRALPNSFDPMSVYIHYPMTVPEEMRTILKDLRKDHLYNFDTPRPIMPPTVLLSHKAVNEVIDNQDTFRMAPSPAVALLMGPEARKLLHVGDEPPKAKSQSIEKLVYSEDSEDNQKWLKAVRDFYEQKTTELLADKSYKLAGVNYADIIRDIGNMAQVHFVAELFSIPLKTVQFPHGIFTEQQLYLIMAAVFCAFSDLDPSKSFPLRAKAREACQTLGNIMTLQVKAIATLGGLAQMLVDLVKPSDGPLKEHGTHLIAQLYKDNKDIDSLVWGDIISTAANLVANQGQLFGLAMDYFLTEGREHLSEINALAKKNTPEADEVLTRYLLEGVRLNGESAVFRVAQKDVTLTDTTQALGTKTYDIKKGDKVMLNLRAAGRDPTVFSPNPDNLDLHRPLDSYQSFDSPTTRAALTAMLKVVGRLDGLRPATVSYGKRSAPHQVKKVPNESVLGYNAALPESWRYNLYLTEDWDQYFPLPTNLKVNWDGDAPVVTTKH